VRLGDTVLVRLSTLPRYNKKLLALACRSSKQADIAVIEGRYCALADQAVRALPLGPINIAVVHACDVPELTAAFDGRAAGAIVAKRRARAPVSEQAGIGEQACGGADWRGLAPSSGIGIVSIQRMLFHLIWR
jgi:hypothetical protein